MLNLGVKAVFIAGLAGYGSDAVAYCSEPSVYSQPPSAPGTYARPSPPYCLSGYRLSGTHTCDRWEIDNYINEINAYINDLSRYASDARNFAEEAIDFANAAQNYAECEAQDVKSEIE